MTLEEIAEKLESIVVNHPNCTEMWKVITWHNEAGEWGLATADSIKAALACGIKIPHDLILEIEEHLSTLNYFCSVKAYEQLVVQAGIPVSETLAAAVVEEREELARINPGWQY